VRVTSSTDVGPRILGRRGGPRQVRLPSECGSGDTRVDAAFCTKRPAVSYPALARCLLSCTGPFAQRPCETPCRFVCGSGSAQGSAISGALNPPFSSRGLTMMQPAEESVVASVTRWRAALPFLGCLAPCSNLRATRWGLLKGPSAIQCREKKNAQLFF